MKLYDSVASRILSRLGLFRLATVFVRFSYGPFCPFRAERKKWLILAEREGFIPAPGELVSKGLFEISKYSYLRKYPLVRTPLYPPKRTFLSTTIN